MAHTCDICCEKCGRVHTLSSTRFDLAEGSVSFQLVCPCGFERHYNCLTPDQFEALTVSISESERLANWLGISQETLSAYVYPPDVMKQADLERRKLGGTALKTKLKASRIAYPNRTADGWWHVYALPGDLDVYYNRVSKTYRFCSGIQQIECDDVHEFAARIGEYI